MNDAQLTIGIPTYNRSEAVTARVEELLSFEAPIEILVIDNASPDDTFSVLNERFSAPNLRVLRNETNLGYAGNLLRVAEESRTPFVTFVSDEDSVDPDGLRQLLDFCETTSPDMVSPQAEVGEKRIYRGRDTTRAIAPAEFQSSSYYLSGLTFATGPLRTDVELVRSLLATNSAASVYPQVLLAALAVARGNAHFLAAHVTQQRHVLETAITEVSGADYRSVASRWAQFLGYEEFFERHLPGDSSTVQEMRESQRAAVVGLVHRAMLTEVSGVGPYLPTPAKKSRLENAVARLRRNS